MLGQNVKKTNIRIVRKRKTIISFIRDWQLYLLLLLPVVYFVTFKYVPMYGVTIAFKDYNMFQGMLNSPWTGLDAFREIFAMRDFYRVLRNTIILNVLDLVVSFPAPIVLALLLNEVRLKWFKKGAQTILYLPHFISWVIIGGMVYQPEFLKCDVPKT